jgi:single stranded DNA-binding protein
VSHVTIVGSIGEVELRTTAAGKPMARFSIREVGRKQDGQDQRPAFFWDAVAFDVIAEKIAAHTNKGDRVIVAGSTDPQEWTDKASGEKRRKNGLVVSDLGLEVRFMEGSGSGSAGSPSSAPSTPPTPSDVPF